LLRSLVRFGGGRVAGAWEVVNSLCHEIVDSGEAGMRSALAAVDRHQQP